MKIQSHVVVKTYHQDVCLSDVLSSDSTSDEDPEFFSTDPDPAQLKKKFRIRIRPEIEMKKKIYLYFR